MYHQYLIQPKQTLLADIEELFSKGYLEKPTIIYTLTKKETESISKFITRTFNIESLPYHAGLTIDQRRHAHTSFITDKIKLKAGIQPIWYLASERQHIDWSSQGTGIPLDSLGEGLGHELAWTVGGRIGLIGLSYTQHEMAMGTQRIISFGLQR